MKKKYHGQKGAFHGWSRGAGGHKYSYHVGECTRISGNGSRVNMYVVEGCFHRISIVYTYLLSGEFMCNTFEFVCMFIGGCCNPNPYGHIYIDEYLYIYYMKRRCRLCWSFWFIVAVFVRYGDILCYLSEHICTCVYTSYFKNSGYSIRTCSVYWHRDSKGRRKFRTLCRDKTSPIELA